MMDPNEVIDRLDEDGEVRIGVTDYKVVRDAGGTYSVEHTEHHGSAPVWTHDHQGRRFATWYDAASAVADIAEEER